MDQLLYNARITEAENQNKYRDAGTGATIADDMNLRSPQFGKQNYLVWRVCVLAYAEEHNLTYYIMLQADASTDTMYIQRKRRAQDFRLITSTLAPEALTKIGDELLEQHPRKMMNSIATAYALDQSPAKHEVLRTRAETLTIKPREGLED